MRRLPLLLDEYAAAASSLLLVAHKRGVATAWFRDQLLVRTCSNTMHAHHEHRQQPPKAWGTVPHLYRLAILRKKSISTALQWSVHQAQTCCRGGGAPCSRILPS